jgi:hypothetical protein
MRFRLSRDSYSCQRIPCRWETIGWRFDARINGSLGTLGGDRVIVLGHRNYGATPPYSQGLRNKRLFVALLI